MIQGNIFNCPLIQYTIDKIKSTKYDVTFTQVFRYVLQCLLFDLHITIYVGYSDADSHFGGVCPLLVSATDHYFIFGI